MRETGRNDTEPHIEDRERSMIDPLPFYPDLYRQLHSLAATVMVAYLEIHHPLPQDANGEPFDGPVTVSAGTIADDLQTGRRTLLVTLSQLAAWWKTEEARVRAARVGREFLNPAHIRLSTVKPYSFTGPKTRRPSAVWTVRRNLPFLRHMLTLAIPGQAQVQTTAIPSDLTGGALFVQGASIVRMKSLGELLLAHTSIGGDGRRSKAERMAGVLGKFSK